MSLNVVVAIETPREVDISAGVDADIRYGTVMDGFSRI